MYYHYIKLTEKVKDIH